MCSRCDSQNKTLVSDYWAAQLGLAGTATHFNRSLLAGRADNTTAFVADGVGDKVQAATQTPTQFALAAAVLDDIPNDTSTTVTITVGGPRLVSTLNTP